MLMEDYENALSMLHDYAISLTCREKRRPTEEKIYGKKTVSKANGWMYNKEKKWRSEGRINGAGYLRMEGN